MDWRGYKILGLSQPLLSFSSGENRVKSFEILLDAHASPHPLGHIANDLENIRKLSIPYDVDGNPVVRLPGFAGGGGGSSGPGRVAGIPPMVKITYGGRVERGVLQNLEITEQLHGTTPQSRGTQLPTRATVRFEFIIVEDSRTLVHWRHQEP